MILLYGVAGFLLIMVITGRIHWLFALLSAAVPWIQRYFVARQAWKLFRSKRKPPAGNTSKVETRYFVMILDHDSGELTGDITKGEFSGNNISDLSLEQLLILLNECRSDDPQSAALLEAFLDRYHGNTWRKDDSTDEPKRQSPTGPMSRREAAEILGLDENSASDKVIETHRRLIQKLHSDRGGTDYLASLVNQARDVLLED
tara:strand:- start:329 stop:937 length:609 start_codon:yes stop_codon:yes gene_type:complete